MNNTFLFACPDQNTLPLARVLAQQSDCTTLGWWNANEAVAGQLAELFPQGRAFAAAEDLHAAVELNTVVFGNVQGSDVGETLLRDLARGESALVLAHPIGAAILAVELDMIQRDTGAAMVPLCPMVLHPLLSLCRQWAQDGSRSPIGQVEQIVLERQAEDRELATVRQYLSQDVMLLRRLLGEVDQVAAQSPHGQQSLANLGVQFTGQRGQLARWSILPVTDSAGAVLTLVGSDGRARFRIDEDGQWVVDSEAKELPIPAEATSYDTAQAIRDHLQASLTAATQKQESPFPAWEDAFRALDIAELAGDSLRRNKTLSVHQGRVTEEDTFKGMMAAGGCLIMMLLPVLLVVLTLLDGLRLDAQKEIKLDVAAGQRSVYLPSNLSKLSHVHLTDDGTALQSLNPQQLEKQFSDRSGAPEAYAVSRGELLLAPIPARPRQLALKFVGSASLLAWWPIVLLVPIVGFLALQLLRFVFPPAGKA